MDISGEKVATKRLRGRAWEFRVTRKSLLPRPLTYTFDTEEQGDDFCARLEASLDAGIVPDWALVGRPRLLREVLSEFQSSVSVKPDDVALLRLIDEKHHSVDLKTISYSWGESWVLRMKRIDNLSPGTVRHYVGALARCLDWCVAKEYISVNPLRQLPRGYAQYTAADSEYTEARFDREMDRRLEEGEEALIRCQFRSSEMLLLFELALETGMRLSEIYPLSWDQVDLSRSTIFLDKTKNGHKRQVPLSSVARKALDAVADKRGDLFPWGEKSRKASAMLSKRFARLFESAGAKGLRFHCLRHEAASRFFERTDLSDLEIMKIMGHSGIKVLARYANLRGSSLSQRLW